MALFPIVGRFVGDFVPHLVPVDTEDTMDVVAQKVAHHSVGRRVAARPGSTGYDVLMNDNKVDPATTIAELGLPPMGWLDVQFR